MSDSENSEMLKKLEELQQQMLLLGGPSTRLVNEVKVKLPNFWTHKPKLWFAQAESQFDITGIKSDGTKYGYVLSMLDTATASLVEDCILNPPSDDKYGKLKAELIKKLSISRPQEIRQLLNGEELGDRKPTVFLQHLRSLAGSTTDEGILRELWLRRLPLEVQRILIAHKDLDLEQVAEIADAILEASSSDSAPVAFAVSNTPSPPEISALLKCIEDLSERVEALSSRSSELPRSSARPQSNTQSLHNSGGRWCWYHKRYGKRASKCIPPCSWKPRQEGNFPSNQ
jgi:hypothetical protein